VGGEGGRCGGQGWMGVGEGGGKGWRRWNGGWGGVMGQKWSEVGAERKKKYCGYEWVSYERRETSWMCEVRVCVSFRNSYDPI